MSIIKEFKAKNFIGRIEILNRIGQEKQIDHLPELFFLYDLLTGDKALDVVVENTLRQLLTTNEEETVKKLEEGTDKEKKLSLRVAGEQHFASSAFPIMKLMSIEKDPELLTQALLAMKTIKNPTFLQIAQDFIHHPDELVSAAAVELISLYNDEESLFHLEALVSVAEADHRYEFCSLPTAAAKEGLTKLAVRQDRCARFLVKMTHHRNPTVRRLIAESLVTLDGRVVPFFEECFHLMDLDSRIMSAAILGRIGKRRGARFLVQAMKEGLCSDDNLRAAVYEALGHIPYQPGREILLQALNETEPQILVTVFAALEQHADAGLLLKINSMIEYNARIELLQAVIHAGALNIFDKLYKSDLLKKPLLELLTKSTGLLKNGPFKSILETIVREDERGDLVALTAQRVNAKARSNVYRILVVDDLNCLLLFYQSVLNSMALNLKIDCAQNGKDALNRIKYVSTEDGPYDLIITDMNMPVMDGVQLTRQVRNMQTYRNVPIIMGTTETEHSQIRLAIKSGVDDILAKPIKPELLMQKVETHLLESNTRAWAPQTAVAAIMDKKQGVPQKIKHPTTTVRTLSG